MKKSLVLVLVALTTLILSACQIPGLSTPDDGPAITPSEEAAASLEQKLAAVAGQGGQANLTVTQQEVTSYLALKLPATVDDGQGNTYDNPLQSPQVYFKADGTIVLRANIAFQGQSQLVRVVAQPSVVDGQLQVQITEGKIGVVPVPGPVLAQLETVLAEGLTAGRDYTTLDQVTVGDGTMTIVGTFQG